MLGPGGGGRRLLWREKRCALTRLTGGLEKYPSPSGRGAIHHSERLLSRGGLSIWLIKPQSQSLNATAPPLLHVLWRPLQFIRRPRLGSMQPRLCLWSHAVCGAPRGSRGATLALAFRSSEHRAKMSATLPSPAQVEGRACAGGGRGGGPGQGRDAPPETGREEAQDGATGWCKGHRQRQCLCGDPGTRPGLWRARIHSSLRILWVASDRITKLTS